MSDATVEKRSIPSFATAIRAHFPELERRAFAVSFVDFKQFRPGILPVALVCLGESGGGAQDAYRGGVIKKADGIVVHYVSKLVKYKGADGTETPYFAYYDYEALELRMIDCAKAWKSPRGGLMEYRGVEPDPGEADVTLNFKFTHHYEICMNDDDNDHIEHKHEELPQKIAVDAAPKPNFA
jgi:hypothetical protein